MSIKMMKALGDSSLKTFKTLKGFEVSAGV